MLSVALSALGIITAAAELFRQIGNVPATIVCLSVLVLYLYLIVQYPHRKLESEMPRDLRYKVIVPATDNQQKRILEACAYFGGSAIDPIDSDASIQADAYSTAALRDYKGREVGFADYYTFNRDDALRYIGGRISKKDFFADYYLPHPQARDAGAIYISTVFRYDHISDRSAFGAKETAILAWCLAKLIEIAQRQPEQGWLIFTAGGSAAGDRLISHFDFEDSGQTDPDGNKIYLRDGVARDELAAGLSKFDYLGNLVQFSVVGLSPDLATSASTVSNRAPNIPSTRAV